MRDVGQYETKKLRMERIQGTPEKEKLYILKDKKGNVIDLGKREYLTEAYRGRDSFDVERGEMIFNWYHQIIAESEEKH